MFLRSQYGDELPRRFGTHDLGRTESFPPHPGSPRNFQVDVVVIIFTPLHRFAQKETHQRGEITGVPERDDTGNTGGLGYASTLFDRGVCNEDANVAKGISCSYER